MTSDETRKLLAAELDRRPSSHIIFARLCNLIEATARETAWRDHRNLERSKECDLERTNTYEKVVSLIESLIDADKKKGLYDAIRRGQE